MSLVVSLEDYRPPPRYDGNAWTSARIEESATSDGTWTNMGTVAFSVVDPDPENPDYRNFTIENGTAADYWYRVTFLDATGDESLPTTPVQNSVSVRPIYTTVEELATLVRVRATDRHASLRRVLEAAAQEIDDEIGPADIRGNTLPYSNPPALVQEVNLERAVEHWQQGQSPFGLIGLGGETQAMYTARDSWDRHALKLAHLKGSWGVA